MSSLSDGAPCQDPVCGSLARRAGKGPTPPRLDLLLFLGRLDLFLFLERVFLRFLLLRVLRIYNISI